MDTERGVLRIGTYQHDLAEVRGSTSAAIYATAALIGNIEDQDEMARAGVIISELVNSAMARDGKLNDRVRQEARRIRE